MKMPDVPPLENRERLGSVRTTESFYESKFCICHLHNRLRLDETCFACHAPAKDHDFVFTRYAP